ncbi:MULTISPECIES: peroxiredoxin-like family protein [Paraburkholderia]|uniref:peroxiredoxin-like family protein n=1 Tax=Paraburkholderia TaxID=1822464 RepID=UPI00225131B2|nr:MULTISPECIES: peroxiredoxin-like family protein [Paraburkholderia]MCX4162437.1 peroxiredoxin-like family protein [Paraburkholderia megapolitana]MDN7157932.1 AhpC/TSA family protein [Paraburkholderia sp. CHISQ3]MDQ6494979.1 AhpC/TSA family protein [Paraburkholderia megapolitana]
MSLQDKLDAFKADFKAGKPPYNAPADIHPIMERATAELIATGQASRAVKAGDRAPDFNLKDQEDNEVSLAGLLKKGPLVVTFYRGVWCPYCNLELKALNEALPELQRYGANVVAISPQLQVNSRKAVRVNELRFPVLSDTHNETADAFGLRFAMPDYLVELYKKLKNDLPAINGDPGWTLPMPARYVIGTDGIVAYSEVNPDYTRRPDPSEMLPILKKLTQMA